MNKEINHCQYNKANVNGTEIGISLTLHAVYYADPVIFKLSFVSHDATLVDFSVVPTS